MLRSVVGLQFGDEGKGKITDYLAQEFDHIVRVGGGVNAGHTVKNGNEIAKRSLLPAVLHRDKHFYIAQGAVISPARLFQEIEDAASQVNPGNIQIDWRCHIVLPLHKFVNQASEQMKTECGLEIGSVGVGIGACYEDKANRLGVRACDLLNESTLMARLSLLYRIRKLQITRVFGSNLEGTNFPQIIDECATFGKMLEPYLGFVNQSVTELLDRNVDVLIEGSQGTFLDNSFGSYPYTVAYSTLAQNCYVNIGIGAEPLSVIGVMKCYAIRVGNGPLPTELNPELADYVRSQGNEYGTVSGRPRRCGWLDLVLVRHACKLNGVSELAITNLDVLLGLPEIKICVGYRQNGKDLCAEEALLNLDAVTPIYEVLPMWLSVPSQKSDMTDLRLDNFLQFVSNYVGVPVSIISFGPDRNETMRVLVDATR